MKSFFAITLSAIIDKNTTMFCQSPVCSVLGCAVLSSSVIIFRLSLYTFPNFIHGNDEIILCYVSLAPSYKNVVIKMTIVLLKDRHECAKPRNNIYSNFK